MLVNWCLTLTGAGCHSDHMSNDVAFSDRQVNQLTELLHSQRESIVSEVKEYVDQRFIEERSVTKQIIHEELRSIRDQLEKLEVRLNNDSGAALDEIAALKQRLSILEAKFAKLKTA